MGPRFTRALMAAHLEYAWTHRRWVPRPRVPIRRMGAPPCIWTFLSGLEQDAVQYRAHNPKVLQLSARPHLCLLAAPANSRESPSVARGVVFCTGLRRGGRSGVAGRPQAFDRC